MSAETLNDSLEQDSTKQNLDKLKNEILNNVESNKSKVNYIRESNNKKFSIYSYKESSDFSVQNIKDKYSAQFGSWIEGTQISDRHGKPLNKENFHANETVYLRVPKNKQDTPVVAENGVNVKADSVKETSVKRNYVESKYILDEQAEQTSENLYRSFGGVNYNGQYLDEQAEQTSENLYSSFGGVNLSYSGQYEVPNIKNRLTKRGGVIKNTPELLVSPAGNKEPYYQSHKETYYSETVLPGGGLKIPGRHVAEDGTVRDRDGYIVIACNYLPKDSTMMTTLGPGKVYDRGDMKGNHIDIYVNSKYFK